MIGKAAETEEAAARWLLRQEEAAWSDADRADLEAWLSASSEHRVAYYRLEHGWRRADRIADLSEPTCGVPEGTTIAGG